MKTSETTCRKCGGECKPSKGFMNKHNIRKSYLREEVEFETKIVDCLKCENCGHSYCPNDPSLLQVRILF